MIRSTLFHNSFALIRFIFIGVWGFFGTVQGSSTANPQPVIHTSEKDSVVTYQPESLVYQPGTLMLAEEHRVGNDELSMNMQADGNLVVYIHGQALWSTDTAGRCAGCVALYQNDGNLVLYKNDKTPVWALNSVGSKELFIRSTAPQVSTFDVPPRQIRVVTPNEETVCNSVAFSQFADDLDLFVGRVGRYADGQLAAGTSHDCGFPKAQWKWELALFRMGWDAGRLVLGETLFRPPQRLPSGVLVTGADDSYLANISGRNWITFECSATVGGSSTVSACVAPFAADGRSLDLSRFTVPVVGRTAMVAATDLTHKFLGTVASASVPKFLLFSGRIYLYWIVVKRPTDAGAFIANKAIDVTTRGMELIFDASGRLWGEANIGKPVLADDSRFTYSVAVPDPQDPTENSTAEVMDLRVVGRKQIEALVAVGGGTCTSPGGHEAGCYRLMKSLTSHPLGENTFGRKLQPILGLPVNPEEYSRYFFEPDGTPIIMGAFVRPQVTFQGKTVPPGFWRFPAE